MATLSKAAIRRVVDAKNQKGLHGYYAAGKALHGELGSERMAYGKSSMAPLVRQLGGAVSQSTLEQCRWLAKNWNERDIKTADRRALPLHLAIRLTFFLSESRKQAEAGNRRMATRCRAAFDRLLQLRPLKVSDLEEEKARLLADLQPGSMKRRVTESREGIIYALNKIRRRIEADAALIGSPASLLRTLNGLERDVQKWYESKR